MFDFHTHILPAVDDGSGSVEESLAMIETLEKQGVSGIVATPHFYAHLITPEEFFANRANAWEQLKPHLPATAPEIRLGAEVLYFEGIRQFDRLKEFCIEGTDLLLLELPMSRWTTHLVDSVLALNTRCDITLVLAHIDRYFFFHNKKAIRQFQQHGILMQVNAEFFLFNRRLALKLLKNGDIHFIGTDTHNMDERKPDLAPALAAIPRKKRELLLAALEQREKVMLY